MLRQKTPWCWTSKQTYPVEVFIFKDKYEDTFQWEVVDSQSQTLFASSYASSLETAYADALAAIEQGAVTTPGACTAACYNGMVVKPWCWRSVVFREVQPSVWVGFHAGQRIEIETADDRLVPYYTERQIEELDRQRATRKGKPK